jgi:diguanylate cyclase (GGDEF)-like protein
MHAVNDILKSFSLNQQAQNNRSMQSRTDKFGHRRCFAARTSSLTLLTRTFHTPSEPSEDDERGDTSPARILIVDDVEDNRVLLARRFQKLDIEIVEAEGGVRALEIIASESLDAVLLDIMMPDMDGLEVLRTIRAQPRYRSLPIIMVTAKTDSADVVEALDLGADDYITKPVNFATALARVKGHIARKRFAEALELSNRRLKEEIASRERSEAKTQYLSYYDSLTKLGNHALLKDRVAQAIAHAARYDRRISLVFIDLDNFKIVNESLGSLVGDEILSLLADRMVKCLPASDTVARLGRDEFVVLLLDQLDSPEEISKVIENLRAAISEKIKLEGHAVSVTSSMGVATYPDDGTDIETLLTNAEAAARRVKEAGRDNFQFYKPEFNIKAYERLLLREELRNAIARSEFVLAYQPQVDLRSGQVLAVEALIRWRHPTLGMISPAAFIPMAEETGLIVPIGDWVMREACRQNKAWQDAGVASLRMCVNVSARQFSDGGLINCVASSLRDSGLHPGLLELELTESLIMQDIGQAVETMKKLRSLGVELSIDDFGTGYSSLAALKTFPIGKLKIDKSFIDDVAGSNSDRAVVRAIISLGKNLGLRVIAEGVETADQASFLHANRCDEIQGFHISKPILAQELEHWLQARIDSPGDFLQYRRA